MAHEHYHDVDLANAAPSLLAGHAVRLGIAAPTLRNYGADREAVLAELMERHTVDRGVAKKLVLLVLNFGDYHRAFEAEAHRNSYDNPDELAANLVHAKAGDPVLDALKAECRQLYRELRDEAPGLHAMCAQAGGNVEGRFMAHLYFEHEARVLEVMNAFFASRGFTVGTLVFDGLMVERDKHRSPDTLLRALRECEHEVQRTTGFSVLL